MSTPVFRFAPSPNGYLHVGHALSALINFEMARAAGGQKLSKSTRATALRALREAGASAVDIRRMVGLA